MPFPSPCGARAFSTGSEKGLGYKVIELFPSPCGARAFSTGLLAGLAFSYLCERFPSPCGARAFSTEFFRHGYSTFESCFHPLAGRGRSQPWKLDNFCFLSLVSIPLRGEGVLNQRWPRKRKAGRDFVSIPLRGEGVLNTSLRELYQTGVTEVKSTR